MVGIMLVRIDTSSTMPLADQIAASVRGSLGRREIAAGERLPAARELAAALDVNVHTVLRAYAALRDDGLIDLRRGRGAVVSGHVDADRTHLSDLMRSFVADARRLGLDDKEMTGMLEKAITDPLDGATS
jgi:GntR family transcriptional regulator